MIKQGTDSVYWKEKYLIDEGITNGHIYLDSALSEGNYILTAFTASSFRDKNPVFHAVQQIRIIKNILALSKKAEIPKTIRETKEKIQFSLLPEGGQLTAGLLNNLAFKAIHENGEPLHISGTLFQNNVPIKTFKTNHAGMGAFQFRPQENQKYEVRLNQPYADQIYALPEIRKKGLNMRMIHNGADSIILRIAQYQAEQQQVLIRIQIRGMTQFIANALLKDNVDISLPTKEIPAGVAEVTLFNANLQPLAERLVYIHPDRQLQISTTLSKTSYQKREKVSLKISTRDQSGKPVPAQLGVHVYDYLYEDHPELRDIRTHYELTSQLRGRIYDPAYYFKPGNKNRNADLDILLLCQGWRSYQWTEQNLAAGEGIGALIDDNTAGHLVPLKVRKNAKKQQAIMAFNSEENGSNLIALDTAGNFKLGPQDFVKGARIYLKNFAEEFEHYEVKLDDPFELIQKIKKNRTEISPIPAFTKPKEIQPSQHWTEVALP